MERSTSQLRNLATPQLVAAVIFIVTLSLHLLYLHYSNSDFFFPDSITYLAPARNLSAGLGFVDEDLAPDTLRTPGYPLFLVPFVMITNSALPIVVVQHLLAALLAAAVFLVALRWSGSRVAATCAALLFAIDTPVIHYANKVLSETLFAVVFFATFLAVLRVRGIRGAVLTGLATGALVLIRPVAILWFVVVAIYFFVSERRRLIAAFAVSALLLPIAWGTRNLMRTSVFTISSIAGTNMLFYRAAGALAITDDYDFPDALKDRQAEVIDPVDELVFANEHVDDREELPHAVQARYFSKVGRQILLQHPKGAFLLTLHGIEMNLLDSDWEAMMMVSTLAPTIIRLSIDTLTHIEFLLAIAGIFAMWRRDRTLALFVGLTLIYFVVISAGGESESRFRVPVMPLYVIAAGFGARRVFGAGC